MKHSLVAGDALEGVHPQLPRRVAGSAVAAHQARQAARAGALPVLVDLSLAAAQPVDRWRAAGAVQRLEDVDDLGEAEGLQPALTCLRK